jgi:hypothetical protein
MDFSAQDAAIINSFVRPSVRETYIRDAVWQQDKARRLPRPIDFDCTKKFASLTKPRRTGVFRLVRFWALIGQKCFT